MRKSRKYWGGPNFTWRACIIEMYSSWLATLLRSILDIYAVQSHSSHFYKTNYQFLKDVRYLWIFPELMSATKKNQFPFQNHNLVHISCYYFNKLSSTNLVSWIRGLEIGWPATIGPTLLNVSNCVTISITNLFSQSSASPDLICQYF